MYVSGYGIIAVGRTAGPRVRSTSRGHLSLREDSWPLGEEPEWGTSELEGGQLAPRVRSPSGGHLSLREDS